MQLAFVWLQSTESLLRVDDTFYYFQVARNAAAGLGSTFDGLHPTNGYQPLWLWLLTGAAWLAARAGIAEPLLLARCLLTLSVALNALTAWLLLRLAGEALGRSAGLAAAVLWMASPLLVMLQLSGMENALTAALVVGSLLLAQRAGADPDAGASLRLGLVAGLVPLARVDGLILVGMLLLWLGPGLLRRRRLGALAALALPALLPFALYLAANLAQYGHPLPVSGAAKALFNAELMAGLGGQWSPRGAAYMAQELGIAVTWLVHRAWGGPLLLLGATAAPLEALSRAAGIAPGYALPLLSTALAAGLALARRRHLREPLGRLARWPALRLLAGYAALQMVTYLLVFPRYFRGSGTAWYFVPAYLLLMLVGAAAATALPRRTPAALLLGALLGNLSLACLRAARPTGAQQAKLAAMAWMRANLPPGAPVGATSAGSLGFLMDRPVVNLDGLANDWAYLDQLRRGEVEAYLRRERIEWIAGYVYGRTPPRGCWAGIRLGTVEFFAVAPSGSAYFVARSAPAEHGAQPCPRQPGG